MQPWRARAVTRPCSAAGVLQPHAGGRAAIGVQLPTHLGTW